MDWIYLSPHLDDAVLSCGGIIWQQVQRGFAVSIWTICAGDPPTGEPLSSLAEMLHARWQTGRNAVEGRRREDEAACAQLGVLPRHFDIPDCIYRRSPLTGEPVVAANDHLFDPVTADEQPLMASLATRLAAKLPDDCQVVSPLGLGGHMDHRLVRGAAESLRRKLWYYADYPYVTREEVATNLQPFEDLEAHRFRLSPLALSIWQNAVAAYSSQISTFWDGETAMRADLVRYARKGGGGRLWRSKND
jgi:LmbE family N-acetylglucosaminyl deacetylase